MSEVSTPGSQRTLAGGAQSQPWHALAAEQARVLLEAPEPLTDESARARYERFGPNQLPEGRTSGPLARLGRQLRNFLIYVLLTAAAITGALGPELHIRLGAMGAVFRSIKTKFLNS